MAITGIGSNYSNVYESTYTPQKSEAAKKAETKEKGKSITTKATAETCSEDSTKVEKKSVGSVVEKDDGFVTLKLSDQALQTQNNVQSFSDTKELMDYLQEKYNVVKQGMAYISESYLRDCLNDERKLQKLFDNLSSADVMDADNRENAKGYQGMKISIDKDGEMETESYSGWVYFNEGKRARQLAAAKTKTNIQQLLGILQADLAECESGKSQGMCDDETISKVNAMIAKAQQQMGKLSGQTKGENPADEQAFLLSGLM